MYLKSFTSFNVEKLISTYGMLDNSKAMAQYGASTRYQADSLPAYFCCAKGVTMRRSMVMIASMLTRYDDGARY